MVTLRHIHPSDRDQMLDILTSEKVNRTYMLPDYPNRDAAEPQFLRLMGMSADNSKYVRAVDLNGELIGFVNQVEVEDRSIELGYVIHPDFHGSGYMTAALPLAMEELFTLGFREIVTGAFSSNVASIRVMQKCGMTLMEKTDLIEYRNKIHTCVYYQKTWTKPKLRYKCLVLDHDDTVVQTERAIGYPYFRDYLEKIRPGTNLTFPEYVVKCNNQVFADMCRANWQFTEEELTEEYLGWKAYSRLHTPPLCPGIDRIIRRQKELGGLICVSSLSTKEIIERDFLHHFAFLPDAVYDYDLSTDKRKPAPYALLDIMEKFSLKPEDLLMVDDMKLGWQMAQEAGVATAFAGWSKAEFPELCLEMTELCDFSFPSAEILEKFLFE